MEPGNDLVERPDPETLALTQTIEEAPVAGGPLRERRLGKTGAVRVCRHEAEQLGAKIVFHGPNDSRFCPTMQSDFTNLQTN